MQSVSMPVMVRCNYYKEGGHFYGTAEIPRPGGQRVVFKVMVPLADIRKEVMNFLGTQPTEISGDPVVIANIGRIFDEVAHTRAKRRLGTAIKVWRGGRVAGYEVAGNAAYATRIASEAARKGMERGLILRRPGGMQPGYDPQDDIGWNPFKAVAKAVTKVAKVVAKPVVFVAKKTATGAKVVGKGIGKGVVATGKGIGKGTVAVAKGGWTASKAIANNPLTSALVSVLPGGAAAMAVVKAAQGGSPGAAQAIVDTAKIADAGNLSAAQSLAALQAAQAQLDAQRPAPVPEKSSMPMILGGVGGGLALLMLLKKR